MDITSEQLHTYLSTGGTRCPFCQSAQIEGGFIEINAYGAVQGMRCVACNHTWDDIHQRVEIVVPAEGDTT